MAASYRAAPGASVSLAIGSEVRGSDSGAFLAQEPACGGAEGAQVVQLSDSSP